MTTTYQELTKKISGNLKPLRDHQPEFMQQFNAMSKVALKGGALDPKTKELIAMALAVAARCAPCIGFHAIALHRLKTTQAELEEMLQIAVYMGGGPSLMYASEALAAFEELAR